MGTNLLSDLEQAELSSRARLLAAAVEADRRVEAAVAVAARIEAGAQAEIDRALAELRDRYRIKADLDATVIEAELAELERAAGDGAPPSAAFDAAVATVVSIVLGETRA